MSYLHRHKRKGVYGYTVTSEADIDTVDLELLKTDHLLLPAHFNEQDEYLSILLKTATSIAEGLTRRDILARTYKAYMDKFEREPIKILKNPVSAIDHIKYYDSGQQVTLDATTYELFNDWDWAYIDTTYQEYWPINYEFRRQGIEIQFQAGYASTTASVPSDLKLAIMQHVAKFYEMKGDGYDPSVTNEGLKYSLQASLPHHSKLIYSQYKIHMMPEDTANNASYSQNPTYYW